MNSRRQQRLARSGAAKNENRGVAPGSKERQLQAPSHDRVKRSEFFQPQIGNGAHHEITAEDSRGAAELAQRRVRSKRDCRAQCAPHPAFRLAKGALRFSRE